MDYTDFIESSKNTKKEESTKKHNAVNHPLHYNTNNPIIKKECKSCGTVMYENIECIDVIRDMPLWKGNAIKYLWRAGLKKDSSMSDKEKEIEDLEKAIFYINDRIKQLKYE